MAAQGLTLGTVLSVFSQLMDAVMLQLSRARNRLTTPATLTLPEIASSGLAVSMWWLRSPQSLAACSSQEIVLYPGGSESLKCLLREEDRAEVGASSEHFCLLCIFLWESR